MPPPSKAPSAIGEFGRVERSDGSSTASSARQSNNFNEIVRQQPNRSNSQRSNGSHRNDAGGPPNNYDERHSSFLPPAQTAASPAPTQKDPLLQVYPPPEVDEIAEAERLRQAEEERQLLEVGAESRLARQFLSTPHQSIVAVTQVNQLPMNVLAARATLYFAEPSGRTLMIRRDLPTVTEPQDQRNPGALSVSFSTCGVENLFITPKVLAVVVIEVSDVADKSRYVLGHAVFRVWSVHGMFEQRLYVGDVNFQSLEEKKHTLPLTTVTVRINILDPSASNTAPTQPFRMFDFAPSEVAIMEDRRGVRSLAHGEKQLGRDDMERVFQQPGSSGAGSVPGGSRPNAGSVPLLDLSFYAPYNEARGVAVVVHSLLHLTAPGDRSPTQLWKVVAEIDGKMFITLYHDWLCDTLKPQFLDAVFVYPNTAHRLNAPLIFRVYRMRFERDLNTAAAAPSQAATAAAPPTLPPAAGKASVPTEQGVQQPRANGPPLRSTERLHGKWLVEEYGWGAASVFLPPKHIRFTASALTPIMDGAPPPEVYRVFKAFPTVAACATEMIERGDWRLKPPSPGSPHRPCVCFSLCDPNRLSEVTADRRLIPGVVTAKMPLHVAFQPVSSSPAALLEDANKAFRRAVFRKP